MRRILCIFALTVSICASLRADSLTVSYTLEPGPPSGDRPAVTHVAMRISGLRGEQSFSVQMPVWSPGDYHVMNHARFVANLRAAGAAAAVAHPDANTWKISTGGADSVELLYDLPNAPPGFFSENVKVTDQF